MNSVAILINPEAPSHIMAGVMPRTICVRDEAGNVYATCWYSRPPVFEDNEDQVNYDRDFNPELLAHVHADKRALILHGFKDMREVLDTFGLVRCAPDGSDLETEE